MFELKQKSYYVNALILLCDWFICIVINQVNEGVIIACCCEYTCDRNEELHTRIKGRMDNNVQPKKKWETMKETLHDKHP